jgi:hypothetical protein
MRFRTLAISTALIAGLIQSAAAYVGHKGAEPPVVAEGRPPRLFRDVAWSAPKTLANLPSWRVLWDRDTDVPLRLWGTPLPAPGASSNPAAAESAARLFLAQHVATLAPGAALTDFTLLANATDPSGMVRTVTFAQHAVGLRVLGGAVAFTFSHDRLIAMSSTALPDVSVRMPGGTLPAHALAASATSWLGQAGFAVDVKAHGARAIMPIVRARGIAKHVDIAYHVVETVTVESSREPGRWDVYLDAASAAPVARKSTLMFASGRVLFDTPDRYPQGTRSPKPAPAVNHTLALSAAPVTSLADGTISWDGTDPAQITLGLVGPLVRISNKVGALVTETITLDPDGEFTWSKANEEYADSQLTAFIAASTAKEFAKTRLNPELAWLNGQIPVVVNEMQTCNAYSTGNDIHFYRSNEQCENTGRLTDVVYHELGHSLHANSIIDGVGAFDGALSEGLADSLAAFITDDHGMGRGFFKSNAPLRDLDPAGKELRWPDDATGEVHQDGEIIGGALWDLRMSLEAKLGAEAGKDRALKIYYGIMQRATDIPSSYIEALISDDDDGDITNGTPNQCEIDAQFAVHGLTNPELTFGLAPPMREGFRVSLEVKTPQARPPP